MVPAHAGAVGAVVGADVGRRSGGDRAGPLGGASGCRTGLCGARPGAAVVAFDVGAVTAVVGAYVGHGRSSAVKGGDAPRRSRVFLGATFDGSDRH